MAALFDLCITNANLNIHDVRMQKTNHRIKEISTKCRKTKWQIVYKHIYNETT